MEFIGACFRPFGAVFYKCVLIALIFVNTAKKPPFCGLFTFVNHMSITWKNKNAPICLFFSTAENSATNNGNF